MGEGLLKLARVGFGAEGDMSIRFISAWGKVVIHVSDMAGLVREIERLNPDAVVVDIGLYDRIGGIDSLNLMRDRLDVNVWFE
jgi:DNA-binding response OmpR family regulator